MEFANDGQITLRTFVFFSCIFSRNTRNTSRSRNRGRSRSRSRNHSRSLSRSRIVEE